MVVQQFSNTVGSVCSRPSDRTNLHWIRWRFTCVSGQTAVCFMHQQKTQTSVMTLWCSADGERGVLVELSKYHSPAVPLPPMIVFFAVVDGTVEISRMRILRNCTCRGTPGAFGACTASRTSHSPSSLRACHSRVHGYMGQCCVSQVARGLT